MTKHNLSNVKLSNLQLNKLKKQKNGTQVTLNLSSYIIGDYETNFPVNCY